MVQVPTISPELVVQCEKIAATCVDLDHAANEERYAIYLKTWGQNADLQKLNEGK